MRDPRASDERRDLMAKAAAPFIHPRVSPIQASYNQPDGGLDVTRLSDQELEAVIRRELAATSLDAGEAGRSSTLGPGKPCSSLARAYPSPCP